MARPKLEPEERRTERYNLRFTVAELVHIQQQADVAGIDVAEYLRRRALGYQVPAAAAGGVVRASLIRQLNGVGINLNQIARSLNSGRPERFELGDILGELRRVLARVLETVES